MKKAIKILKKMNKKAIKNENIPVSCIIIKNNQIISKAYNKKYKYLDPLGHAEIIAIKKACKKLKTTNLIECEMVVTLCPCKMCKEIINECRIKKVYYILNKEKESKNNVVYEKINIEDEEYFKSEIKSFFANKR